MTGFRKRPLATLPKMSLSLLALTAAAQSGPDALPSNPDMEAIFKADQDARHGSSPIDWPRLRAEDAGRRARTRQLLDAGALGSGEDFLRAAFIFQHGDGPDDFLLAHTLAIIAAARGTRAATWIAAATLDRYLQTTGRKQIYGTQYRTPADGRTTQEPYDRILVSDPLREALGVPPQAEQERRRTEIEARRMPPVASPDR